MAIGITSRDGEGIVNWRCEASEVAGPNPLMLPLPEEKNEEQKG
jgi:hypothetical protein